MWGGLAIHHRSQLHTNNFEIKTHVFGLGTETGVPGGNPKSTGRTFKPWVNTQGGSRNHTPTIRGVTKICIGEVASDLIIWRVDIYYLKITGGEQANRTTDDPDLGCCPYKANFGLKFKACMTITGNPASHAVTLPEELEEAFGLVICQCLPASVSIAFLCC